MSARVNFTISASCCSTSELVTFKSKRWLQWISSKNSTIYRYNPWSEVFLIIFFHSFIVQACCIAAFGPKHYSQEFSEKITKSSNLSAYLFYFQKSLCQAEQSLESAVADERVTRAIERTEQVQPKFVQNF